MKRQSKRDVAQNVSKLFDKNSIPVLCMKLYSSDEDIDIVVIHADHYISAQNALADTGWFLRNNKSKLRERDKDFFHHKDTTYTVHLHRAFSWNTVVYLNSDILFSRKRKSKGLFIPSAEDELLIIAAHSLFENQYITPEEVVYGARLLQKPLDYRYMREHALEYGWADGFDSAYSALVAGRSKLTLRELMLSKAEKLISALQCKKSKELPTMFLNYFLIDWIWNYRLMLKKTHAAENNNH